MPNPYPEITPRLILQGARRILEDGGDPDPCPRGAYCPYCCIAIAKGDLEETEESFAGSEGQSLQTRDAFRIAFGANPSLVTEADKALVAARAMLASRDACHGPYAKESALAAVDAALVGCE